MGVTGVLGHADKRSKLANFFVFDDIDHVAQTDDRSKIVGS
jgi:hypothetical protein